MALPHGGQTFTIETKAAPFVESKTEHFVTNIGEKSDHFVTKTEAFVHGISSKNDQFGHDSEQDYLTTTAITCEANVVGSTNICLESVGEEEEEGVRKVLHMGDTELISSQGHIVVEDGTLHSMSDIPEHEYPAAIPVKGRRTKKRGPGDIIVKQIKTENGEIVEKKMKIYTQRYRKAWQRLPECRGWLRMGTTSERAHCSVCNKELTAGKSELLKHAAGKKHQRRMELAAAGQLGGAGAPVEDADMPVMRASTVMEGTPHHTVDLRSDTVTYPSIKMKEAMFRAPMGDDVFGEDPTVKELEKRIAALLGKESALLVPSGTMANLICVMAHCWTRGSEVILGDQSHLHVWAQGGLAQVGNVHHRTLKNLPDGTFSLLELKAVVRGDDPHWPVTGLVCIENTQNMVGGKALPLRWLDEVGAVCQELGLPLHCDGARLLNAAVAVGQPPSRLVRHCQSVAFCINKGLGAPMGSLVVGSKEFIERAIRVRKVLGGGLHQAGMFAAAGLYALEHVAPRLSWDHTHARAIAQGVKEMHSSAVTVDLKEVQTNMVLLHTDNIRVNAKKLCDRLAMVSDDEAEELDEQTNVLMLPITDTVVRCMTHCALTKSDIASVVKKLKFVINEYDSMVFLEYKIEVGAQS